MRRILSILSLVLLSSCGTLAGNPEDDAGKGTGTTPPPSPAAIAPVSFALTDAPVEDARSVLINVTGIEVSLTGEAWVDIPMTAPAEIDLLQFQEGNATGFAEAAALPVGTYQQTRLKLAADNPARLIELDGTEHALKVPSGSETGLKITTPFTAEAGKPLKLTIDFDLRKSVKHTGGGNGKGNGNGDKYLLKPTLRLVRDDGTGGIKGDAADGKVVCVYKQGTPKDATDDCDGAETSAKVRDGQFKIGFLPAGVYDLRIFTNGGAPTDIDGVTVVSGEIADAAK